MQGIANDILVVDDESDIRSLITEILTESGYPTRQAANSDQALAAIAERIPSLVLLDIWLHGSELDGLGILELISERYPWLPVIMISGHGNIETAVGAIRMGAYDFIEKPFKEEQLVAVVNRAMELARLKQENFYLRQKTLLENEILGNSQSMKQLRQSIKKVAPTNSRVLITGPSGVGKEVVARTIHAESKRSGGPFVVMSAASFSSVANNQDRIDIELFGLEEGSGFGGGPKSIGLLEKAHTGTLFIDEVAEMPISTQAKLLRVLQEQSFTRTGSTRQVKVDVRVVAASARNIQAEILAGNFREDLYYRLNVVPLNVPGLTERREDIPLLCRYFLKRSSEILGLAMRKLSDDLIATLQSYHWPGNVRQLRNLMEWLLIMTSGSNYAEGDEIRSDMLPSDFLKSTPAAMTVDMNADIMSMPLREAREMFEKQYLASQVTRFGGNISKTSSFVGMERSALHRKLKSLGIGNYEERESVE